MGFLRGILPAVGTAVGAYFGGPWGAAAGSAIGSALSGNKGDTNGGYDNTPVTAADQTVTTEASGMSGGTWGAIGQLGGGLLNYLGQSGANKANTAQAANQMAFQREMSNTSYQRGMADMKAAGLNPMLAYQQGGATTPSGAQAAIVNPNIGAGQAVAQAPQAAAALANTGADTDLKDATASATRSNTALNTVRKLQIIQDTETSAANAQQLQKAIDQMIANIGLTEQQTKRLHGTSPYDILYAKESAREKAGQAETAEYEAKNPWVRQIGSLIGSAKGIADIFGRDSYKVPQHRRP